MYQNHHKPAHRAAPRTAPQTYYIAPHALRSFHADRLLDAGAAWLPLVLAVLGMWIGYFVLPRLGGVL